MKRNMQARPWIVGSGRLGRMDARGAALGGAGLGEGVDEEGEETGRGRWSDSGS